MESIGLFTPPDQRMSMSWSTFWRRPEEWKLVPFGMPSPFVARVSPPAMVLIQALSLTNTRVRTPALQRERMNFALIGPIRPMGY